MTLFTTGNFAINTTTDAGFKLDVTGTARITSSLTANSLIKSGGTSTQYLMANGSVVEGNSSTGVVRYGDYITIPTFSGKSITLNQGTIKELLWGGQNIRFTVTDTYTGSYPAAGSTWVRTYELIDGTSATYSTGAVYCGFWVNYPPANMTVRVQNTSGTWYGPYTGSNISVSGSFQFWKVACGGPNYIKKWEITFTPTAGFSINLQTVNIVIDNSEGIDQVPLVSRAGSSIYGTLSFIGTSSATKAYINNSGVIGGTIFKVADTTGLIEFQNSVGTKSGSMFMDGNIWRLKSSNNSDAINIFNNGNIGINQTTDAGYKLDVNGTARVATSGSGYKLTVATNGGSNGSTLLVSQLGYTMLDVNASDVIFKPYPSPAGQITTNNWNSAGGSHTTFIAKNSEFTPTGIAYAIPIAKFPDANIPVVMGNTATANLRSYLTVSGNFTSISNLAAGQRIISTLTAAANNDVLVGLDINPTFTNGAYTGVKNFAFRATVADAKEAARFTGTSGTLRITPYLSSTYGVYVSTLNAAESAQIPLSLSSNKFIFENGNVLIGATTDNGNKLQVTGNITASGGVIASTLGAQNSAEVNVNESSNNLLVYADITGGPDNLYSGGQVKANIYTSSGNTVMSVAYFCNYSSSPAQITVHLVPSGGSANVLNRIYSNVSITAGDTLVVETEKIIFSSGDMLQANASANTAINSTVSFTGV